MKEDKEFKTPPKWLALLIIIFIILIAFFGCRPKMIYVPVENTKIEYKDKYIRDSIHLYDSVFLKMKGDTVWFEKYKYLYRDKLRIDSFIKMDSIQVPYPVEVEKEVNRLNSFQSFQIWCGRILLLLLIGWLVKYPVN